MSAFKKDRVRSSIEVVIYIPRHKAVNLLFYNTTTKYKGVANANTNNQNRVINQYTTPDCQDNYL